MPQSQSSHIPEQTVIAGRYEVGAHLGSGGMGVVYEVRDLERQGARCALKVLKAPHENEQARLRFEEEVRCASKLSSPHIVEIYGTGNLPDERPFVVMELLHGAPLLDMIQVEPRLGVERALHIARGLLLALRVAHEAGVVHRDLKPANVYVDSSAQGDVVKILDFGIAKDLSRAEDLGLTRTGMLVGTPSYMSPERFSATEPVTPSTDLYAVGLMLYRMLTGEPLVYAQHPALPPEMRRMPKPLQICWLHLHLIPPRVMAPQPLADLIARLLSKTPQERPSAREALRVVVRLLAEYGWAQPEETASLPGALFEEITAAGVTRAHTRSMQSLKLSGEVGDGQDEDEGLEGPRVASLPPSDPHTGAHQGGEAASIQTLALTPLALRALHEELDRAMREHDQLPVTLPLSIPPPLALESEPAGRAQLASAETALLPSVAPIGVPAELSYLQGGGARDRAAPASPAQLARLRDRLMPLVYVLLGALISYLILRARGG